MSAAGRRQTTWSGPSLAAVALLGAGTIHLASAVAERDRTAVAAVLAAVGLVQVGWAAATVAIAPAADDARTMTPAPSRRRTAVGLGIAAVSALGWILAVTVGLPAPEELASPVDVGAPDLLAAILALVAAAVLVRSLLVPSTPSAGASSTSSFGSTGTVAAGALGLLALVGVIAVPAASDARRAERAAAAIEAEGSGAIEGQGAGSGAVAPFDPARPLDLSGVPTVTPEQESAATALVLAALDAPHPTVEEAEALGYRSIGDAFTGEEHLIDWSRVDDGVVLDPSAPEALVYDVAEDGTRTLVSFMFMEPPGTRIDDAPTPGGALTRWHLHGDLCLDPSTAPPSVGGSTDATGTCPSGLEPLRQFPTLHVWLVAHPCGPFSELEGVGTVARSVPAGCEHDHG